MENDNISLLQFLSTTKHLPPSSTLSGPLWGILDEYLTLNLLLASLEYDVCKLPLSHIVCKFSLKNVTNFTNRI